MRAVVIEDSRLARNGLIRMLQSHPSVAVVGEAEHPQGAREIIAAERPDLLFLDIHMPGESGFQLLESLDYTPKIIFTTAYAEYAIQSFEHNTVDYLLKPISEERLATAIAKLSTAQAQDTDTPASAAPLDLSSRLFVKDNEHCFLIALNQIQYIESCKNYVQIFFTNNGGNSGTENKKAFVKKSLNLVETRLPASSFFRVSRQYIVNLNAIMSIALSVSEGYELTMEDGQTIEVSRRNAARLKERLSL